MKAGQEQDSAPAVKRLQDERPCRVAEPRPQAFLADPFDTRVLELEEQEVGRLESSDRVAFVADNLTGLRVLKLGMIRWALGIPELSAKSNAYQPARR